MKSALKLEEPHPRGTIAALDGVRAIACLMVIAYHISLMTHDIHLWSMDSDSLITALLLAGNAGVTLFFVLSGFLLFLPYANALLFGQPWPSARIFYLRRALRIIPGYYFSLLLIVLLAHPEYLQPQRWGQLLLFPVFLMDSTRATFQQLNGPYWTLAIEWQFYLLLPLIALGILAVVRLAARLHLARPEKRLWAIVACLLGVAGWGVFTRYWGAYFMAHPAATFLVPRAALNVVLFIIYGADGKFLEDFALGMLAGLAYTALRHPARQLDARQAQRYSRWLWGCGLLWLLFLVMQYVPALRSLFYPYSWLAELGLSLGFACCILAVLFDGAAPQRFFEWMPLRWVGLISFSLYIWHLPLLNAFQRNIAPSLTGLPPLLAYSLYWLWVAAVVFPFSFAVYQLIEKPGMRLSNRLRQRMSGTREAQPRPGDRELVGLASPQASHA
ncbi:MAG TPA: acyltransferase [Ktedonobacterales bacterium]|nr:acyltransferase [Ktedonobacterales bacterium]